jgi:hypothetical protein
MARLVQAGPRTGARPSRALKGASFEPRRQWPDVPGRPVRGANRDDPALARVGRLADRGPQYQPGPVAGADRRHAADGLVDPAGRLPRLLQRPLVRVHRRAARLDRRRGLERHVPSRRPGPAWARWRHSLETGEPYEIEYRLRHHSGEYRWTLGRALPVRDRDGKIVRWIGTCTDIDAAKRAAEDNELLSRELSHRIKNIFAVISGLIGLSSRHDPTMRNFAKGCRIVSRRWVGRTNSPGRTASARVPRSGAPRCTACWPSSSRPIRPSTRAGS